MTDLVERFHQFIKSSKDSQNLLTLLWAPHDNRFGLDILQKKARRELDIILKRFILRILQRISGVLPNKFDDLEKLDLDSSLKWVHEAYGGDIEKYPIIIKCNSEDEQNKVFEKINEKYNIPAEIPLKMDPEIWKATSIYKEKWEKEDKANHLILRDYAEWIDNKTGRSGRFSKAIGAISKISHANKMVNDIIERYKE